MTTPAQHSIDVLSRGLDQAARVLAAVPRERLSDPTPCGDWDVADLLAHLVVTPRNFLTMSAGGTPDWSATPPLPADWTAEFRTAADDLLRRWQEAGDAASPQAVDWQTAEFAVHTWDLARATGQPTDLDPEVAQRGLDFMSSALTPENRGSAFGPAVTLPPGAPVYERLVAFAGRDPRP
jgi:uncharacterized protein (TIGR03086 family)